MTDERYDAAALATELVPLLERIADALERVLEAEEAIAAKLDTANERLESIEKSQWSPP